VLGLVVATHEMILQVIDCYWRHDSHSSCKITQAVAVLGRTDANSWPNLVHVVTNFERSHRLKPAASALDLVRVLCSQHFHLVIFRLSIALLLRLEHY